MSEVIYIPPSLLLGKELHERIRSHNAVVTAIWRERGSACKPFQSPSTVPADTTVLSRVVVSAEHGGSPALEVSQ